MVSESPSNQAAPGTPKPKKSASAPSRPTNRASNSRTVWRVFFLVLGSTVAVLPALLYTSMRPSDNKALIVYNYHPRSDDPEYTNNFLYFVREGIVGSDGNDYIVVVQLDYGQPAPQLPRLPSHARYITHPNECFDLGTIGWLLDHHVKASMYKYFVFLNSGVRGPFLPGWVQRVHWVEELVSKLNSQVKMVGPTINCGGAFNANPIPHVQTYTFAVDFTGLGVLMRAGVFQCFRDWQHAIVDGELGAARAIFQAGYTIDCLLLRYQGIDWRDPSSNSCNANLQPIQHGQYDGISVHPLEVMFMKVKSSMVDAGWESSLAAIKYDKWAMEAAMPPAQRTERVKGNQWKDDAPAVLNILSARGGDCFDSEFYISSGFHDLKILLEAPEPAQAAWEHFITHGYMEGRMHRFKC